MVWSKYNVEWGDLSEKAIISEKKYGLNMYFCYIHYSREATENTVGCKERVVYHEYTATRWSNSAIFVSCKYTYK